MKYIVFEAGSRAGFSAEMFFRAWLQNNSNDNVSLVLADSDPTFTAVPSDYPILRKYATQAEAMVGKRDVRVFPGDELTRQRNGVVRAASSTDLCSKVHEWYYDKSSVNCFLQEQIGDDIFIKIPKTFHINDVCIKPNSLSAGSKEIMFVNNACVSERIKIAKEYVVDVLEPKHKEYRLFAREVKLRNGYDKYVRLLPDTHKLVAAVRQFIELINEKTMCTDFHLFHDIFHLQIAEDVDGQFYFIEASKRISGSSIVNLFKGFNPFDVLEGTEPAHYDVGYPDDVWFRFEDIISHLSTVI